MSIASAHRLVAIFLLTLGALFSFTGCESTAPSSASGQDSIRTLTTSGNTNWVLVQWTSAGGEKQSIPPPAPTMLIGYQGRISGQAGVNSYVGNVTISDGILNWGEHIALTRASGSPELMASENQYLNDLKATRKVTIRQSRLIFTGEKPLRLEFARADP
ncbi:MAG: heat-shock protein [Rariglobus sp.]|jgi:heat shock protein HslJ|nr:heat-shock protein [Rariglobus sp.]